jgi:spore coat polysaccharide biosynthesis protein SpsF
MLIDGKTLIERVIERVKQATLVEKIVVVAPHDLEIELEVPVFLGSEQDVLKRYYDCATKYKIPTIVRITSDCPLLDPEIIDYAIKYYYQTELPYVYFAPADGLDVEVFSYELLKEAHKKAKSKEDREHVTPYMRRYTKLSVDEKKDLEKVRDVWNGLVRLCFWQVGQGVLGRHT